MRHGSNASVPRVASASTHRVRRMSSMSGVPGSTTIRNLVPVSVCAMRQFTWSLLCQ